MKKISILILLSLIAVLMAVGVQGTITCSISDYDYLYASRLIQVNVTYTPVGVDNNSNTSISNATIDVTGCTTTKLVNTTKLENNSNNRFNFTVGLPELATWADETQCTLTAKLYNMTVGGASGLIATCTAITLYPDTSAPKPETPSPSDSSRDTDGTVTFSISCGNASSATLYVDSPTGYREYTMSESSDTCTYSNFKFLTSGFQSWYVIASDGLNTTTSDVWKVEISLPGSYIYDEQGNIVSGTAGSPAPPISGNVVTRTVNGIFDFIFGIFDTIFSVFRRG